MDDRPFFLQINTRIFIGNNPGMNTYEKIGQLIKLLRAEHHLSQEQLSDQCNIDQHYISNIEHGLRIASVDIIERLASFFGLSLSQFFACVESMSGTTLDAFCISKETQEQAFVRFMQRQNLSAKTIKKYSYDTPNCPSVQRIIKSFTGTTSNMYHICNLDLLEKIIDKVSDSDFDRIGHSMYSAGLEKYKLFLESITKSGV